jgi:hypothetical protein
MKQMQVRSFEQYFKHITPNNIHDASGFNIVNAGSKQSTPRRQQEESLHNSSIGIYRLYEADCCNTVKRYYFRV